MFANAKRMICPSLGQQVNEGSYQETWILSYVVAWLLPYDISIHLVLIEAQYGENPKEGSGDKRNMILKFTQLCYSNTVLSE